MGDVSSGKPKRKGEDKPHKLVKKQWTPKEDAALIAALAELCNDGWKRENGIYRGGYTAALERKLKLRLPGCNIKATPHIESRLKLLKRQYDAITETHGAVGIQWDSKENVLRCDDDDVWEEWIQTHTYAKGLRNKQFPYYKDLHFLFGNRTTTRGLSKEFGDDEENIATAHMTVDDSLEDDETFPNISFTKDINDDGVLANGRADCSIEHCKKRKVQRDVITTNASDYSTLPDRSNDSTGTNKLDGDNPVANANVLNKCCCNSEGSSQLGKLAKIFGTFLDKYQEHISLLSEVLGREKILEKRVSEKRARLNGELMKFPSLNLQGRLRAASMIASDPAKLDLFYSLSEEERT